jgi:hypothetical protein
MSPTSRLLLLVLFSALARDAGFAGVPAPTFLDRQDYASSTCGNFSRPAIADINGDGIPDVICGNVNTFLGNGYGTFRTGPSSPVFFNSSNPVAMDLNGDGKVDLVLVTGLSGSGPFGLSVTFGNGDGTFGPGTFYQTGTDSLADWAVLGDFNGDGIADAGILTQSGVWLFIGKGAGILEPGVLTPLSGSQPVTGLFAVDINGDGLLDLVAGQGSGIAVLLGNGDGTFQHQIDTPSGLRSIDGFAVGDLNGDGVPDLVFSLLGLSVTPLCLGRGDGSFSPPQDIGMPSSFSIRIADINGDHIPDLIGDGVYTALGRGDGSFVSPEYYPTSGDGIGASAFAANLRNDGTDLVIANSDPGISVLLNKGNGTFQDGEWVPVSGGGGACAQKADFNGDGRPDLAVTVDAGVSILLGTGKASSPFTQGALIPVTSPGCPLVGDVNGDGIPDLILTSGPNFGAGSVVSYMGKGDGTFTLGPSSPIAQIGQIVIGDFNGDGKLDYASSTNLLAYGNGDGSFQAAAPFVPYVEPSTQVTGFTAIGAGRLNGDREKDIILVDGTHNLMYVLLSAGAHGFRETITNTQAQCYFPIVPVIADVNGDGYNDLVLGCIDPNTPIYLNDGSGKLTYSTTVRYGLLDDASFPAVADVNGDGIPDVLVEGDYDTAVFLGEGSMQFAAPFYLGHGPEPGGTLTMNLHGQNPGAGKPDLVIPDDSGKIEVILNLTK